jgi:hypothetical protein
LVSVSNAGGRGGRQDECGHGDVEDSGQHVRGGVAGVAIGSKVWVDMSVRPERESQQSFLPPHRTHRFRWQRCSQALAAPNSPTAASSATAHAATAPDLGPAAAANGSSSTDGDGFPS